jgi:hypothetical protein
MTAEPLPPPTNSPYAQEAVPPPVTYAVPEPVQLQEVPPVQEPAMEQMSYAHDVTPSGGFGHITPQSELNQPAHLIPTVPPPNPSTIPQSELDSLRVREVLALESIARSLSTMVIRSGGI